MSRDGAISVAGGLSAAQPWVVSRIASRPGPRAGLDHPAVVRVTDRLPVALLSALVAVQVVAAGTSLVRLVASP